VNNDMSILSWRIYLMAGGGVGVYSIFSLYMYNCSPRGRRFIGYYYQSLYSSTSHKCLIVPHV